MRFAVLVKASKESESGQLPDPQMMAEMGKFNDELVKAGVMEFAEGLHASKDGVRVRFAGKSRTVIDGPFPETKELVAGFWIWKLNSREEAIEWLKKCPNPHLGESEVEIRQIFEAEEIAQVMSKEHLERKIRFQEQTAKNKEKK
jgi:hypothetical protein